MRGHEQTSAPQRPDTITLENYEESIRHFGQIEPNWLLLRAMHHVANGWYRPRVHEMPGALDEAATALRENTSFLMISNHIRRDDQFVIGGAIQRAHQLHSIRGSTHIISKPEYFNEPLFPGARFLLVAAGAIPLFRPRRDVPDAESRLVAQATMTGLETAATLLVKGEHVFMFPEGTRNQGDPSQLLELEKGIDRLAHYTETLQEDFPKAARTKVAILPIVIWYGEDKDKRHAQPHVLVSNLIHGPFERRGTHGRATEALTQGLAHVIEIADSHEYPLHARS